MKVQIFMKRLTNKFVSLFKFKLIAYSLIFVVIFILISGLVIAFIYEPSNRIQQLLLWFGAFDIPYLSFCLLSKKITTKEKRNILYVSNLFMIIIILFWQEYSQGNYELILAFFGIHMAIDQVIDYKE
jgi:hypothetical protein